MRTLSICFFIAFLTACATPATMIQPQNVQGVIDVPGATQSQIYEGTRQWIAENFRSANNVIQYADTATHTVIGNNTIANQCRFSGTNKDLYGCGPFDIRMKMKAEARDNRLRLTFLNFSSYFPARPRTTYTAAVPAQELEGIPSEHENTVSQYLETYGDSIRQYIERGKTSW